MRFDLFSSGRLYKALEDAGYPDLPAKRTLQDWIKNDSAPQSARLAVARILELGTTKEAPPPAWVEGLYDRLVDEVRTNREVIVAALGNQIGREVGEALRELQQQPPDEPAPADARREE